MIIEPTRLDAAYILRPEPFADERGVLYESFRFDQVLQATGIAFEMRQVNHTVNHIRTLRGIHGTSAPPGQAKLVTCVRGASRTVLVDLRVGSKTFGETVVHKQIASIGDAILVPSGVGLAYLALEDDTCMSYLYTTEYVAGHIIDVHPLDPVLEIDWAITGSTPPVLSARDAAAPTLAQALAGGLLPSAAECLRHPQGASVVPD